MTDLDLDAIQARVEAATPGPWVHEDPGFHANRITSERGDIAYTIVEEADGQFIIHAREDVPRMVAEIRRLRKIIERQNLTGGQ